MDGVEICRKGREEYKTTHWSGGATTELVIDPPAADLGARNFSYRISSAVFMGTESDFSDFAGYRRVIFPLRGQLTLRRLPDGAPRTLHPYEIYRFEGSWRIRAQNTPECMDFNLIVREGIRAHIELLHTSDFASEDGASVTSAWVSAGTTYLFSESDVVFSLHSAPHTESHIEPHTAGGDSAEEVRAERCKAWETVRIRSKREKIRIEIAHSSSPVVLCHIP